MSEPVLLKLAGRLDTARVGTIETEFYARAGAVKDGAVALIDMRDVDFLSSLGIRLILSSAKLLGRRNVRVGIINSRSANVVEALTVAGIAEIIPGYDSEEAAVAGLGS
jgi:anti-anti-sigma factor